MQYLASWQIAKKKITTAAISSIDVLMYYYFCLVVVGGWWFWWLVVQDQKQKLCAICMLNGLLPFSSSKDIVIKFQCLKKKSVDIIHFFPFHYIPLLLIHYLRKLRRICFIFYIIHIINYFSLFVTYGNIENSKYIFVLYCFSMKVRNTRK